MLNTVQEQGGGNNIIGGAANHSTGTGGAPPTKLLGEQLVHLAPKIFPATYTVKINLTDCKVIFNTRFSKIPPASAALPQTPLYSAYSFFEKYILHKVILWIWLSWLFFTNFCFPNRKGKSRGRLASSCQYGNAPPWSSPIKKKHWKVVQFLLPRLKNRSHAYDASDWLTPVIIGQSIRIYTVGHKNGATFIFAITLANVGRFQ